MSNNSVILIIGGIMATIPRENRGGSSFTAYLSDLIRYRVFSNVGWPEWLGGILLGLLNVFFLALALKPFTIYGGFENWGRHVYSLLGIFSVDKVFTAHRTSVGDIGLFLGALLAALAAGEFRVRRGFPRDYLEGILGGVLMALGVVMSWGCNWGGFFSAIIPLSLHGYGMFIGLIIGGYLGLLYVRWSSARLFAKMAEVELEVAEANPVEPRGYLSYPARLGVGIVIAIIFSLMILLGPGGGPYLAMTLIGLLVGIVIQRSRFCFATAFRELFGGVEMARAVKLQIGIALGIIVGATGAAILKYMGYVDPGIYVKYISISNVIGGIIFAFGMSIAGACASGSLWKAAEGNLKILAALLAAVFTYPFLKLLRGPLVDALNPAKVYIPDALGWGGGLLFIYLTMLIWMILVLYYSFRRGVKIYG